MYSFRGDKRAPTSWTTSEPQRLPIGELSSVSLKDGARSSSWDLRITFAHTIPPKTNCVCAPNADDRNPTFVKVIPAFQDEANLKRRIRAHLKSLGFTKAEDGSLCPPDSSKETYRHLHRKQRKAKFARSDRWFKKKLEELKVHFSSGADINPENIVAELEEIPPSKKNKEDWRGYLFRLASLTWSVPVSSGYRELAEPDVGWQRSHHRA